MIALALLVAAWGAVPETDMHMYGSVGDEGPGIGVGAGVAGPVGPLYLEGALDFGGIAPGGPEGHGWFFVRWFPAGAEVPVAPSFRLGPGLRIADKVAPELMAGVAVDFPAFAAVRPRLAVDGIVRLRGPVVGRLTLAFVVGRVSAQRESRAPAPFEDPTGQARVWIPHPVCQWVPASEVDAWVGQVPPDQPLVIQAPGYVPVEAPAGDLGAVTLERAPEHGSVIVVASPGDRIRVGDSQFEAPQDGVVVLDLPVGVVSIGVTHNGNLEILEAAVADGYAVWVRSSSAGAP